MIKVVFFDVDGTLVSHTKGEVPVSTRQAVSRLKEKRDTLCHCNRKIYGRTGKTSCQGYCV